MTAISLREWETVRSEPCGPLAQMSLASYPAARRLADRLTRAGCLEVLELAHGLELRATSFVGRISLGELTVTIRPKILGTPLMNLLRYAYGLRHLHLYGAVNFDSTPWAFQDLLIDQLAAEANELLKRGVHRDYERRHTDLVSPRGRIDFTRYVRTAHRVRTVLPCVHHPRSEDTLLNRVLLAGLNFASALTNDAELRSHVRRLGKVLGATVSAQPLDWSMLSKARNVMDRRTTAYQPALTLVGLLLDGQGPALDEPGSRIRLKGFLFDMNRFFQMLVSRLLHEHLASVVVHDEFRLKGIFSYDPGQNPLARREPTLRPDFVVMRGGQILSVLDAKYRDLWEHTLPREMLYQLALYALSRPVNDRTSVILYPTVEAAACEQKILIRDPVFGAPQANVTIRPVNLLELEKLLGPGRERQKRRAKFTYRLAFG